MTETMKLPPQARGGVSLRAGSFNADDNTIEVVFTTGASVMRFSWCDGPYLETLDVTTKSVRLDRLNAGAPFLNTHSSWDLEDVIGSVVPGSARIEGGLGIATIKLSAAAGDADTISKIRDGVIRNVSVGYIIHQAVMTEAGEDGSPATCRVTDWEPIEISAVPIPADKDAQIRSATGKVGEERLFPCAVIRASQVVSAPQAVTPSAGDVRKAETARVQGIISTTRQLGLADDFADKHVAEGTALDAFRSLAIDAAAALRSKSPEAPAAPAVPTGDTAMTDRANDTHASSNADASRAAPTAPVAPSAPLDATAIRTVERERIAGIRVVARKLKLADTLVDEHIDGGTSLDAFRALAIDAAEQRQAPVSFAPNPGASEHRSYAAPKAEKEKGVDAARILTALAATRGSRRDAADFITQKYGVDGEVAARALGTSVGSAGGFLVPPDMSSEIIELLRPASVVMASGPRIIPMPHGNMMIPRVTGGSNASYVGENQPINASQPQFGAVQLVAKKLAAEVPISNDMIRFASAATDGIVRDDMVRSIAVRSDIAFIRGQGTQFSPRGLKSYAAAPSLAGANVIAAGVLVGSAYAVDQNTSIKALASVTTDLGKAELALMNANIAMSKPGWLMAPRTAQYLMNIRDGLGNQIYYAEMSTGKLRGKPFKVTTQIPTNLAAIATDGVTPTTDGSEIYLVDFAEVFIGEAYGLEIEVFPGGAYVDSTGTLVSGISNDQTVMRAIVQHDMAMRQEAAVAVITGVRWF